MSVSLLVLIARTVSSAAADPDPTGVEFFEKHVRPILVQHCYECHGGMEKKGELRLDSREGWNRGGDSGPAIVAGKPDDSLMIQAVRYGGDYEMPPKGKLPEALIVRLEQWVRLGAPDPRVAAPADQKPTAPDMEMGRPHWAYQPIQTVVRPSVQNGSWPNNAIDCFILARLEAAGLFPSGDAPRAVLARRLYFDLWGLPPTPEQIDEFVADTASDAYERLVDRLLASPHFGERWGRHWLDVARFGESITLRGFVLKEAWRYRDYVIECFNGDRPYDQFLREQISGDLLPATTLADRQRNLVATTYLALGNTNLEEQDKKQLEMDVVDEQLDVISKGILAQTITCARCHDHKFDPIPTRDYYAMAGILKNVKSLEHANVSKWVEVPLPLEPQREEIFRQHAAAVAALQEKIKPLKNSIKLVASTPGAIVSPQDLPGIVVDDRQAKRVGEWKESQFTNRYIGEGYLHDLNQGKGERTLTFNPELPRDGKYEVRFAYTAAENRDQKVPVTVFSADGEKTIYVNEQEPGTIDGRWVSLGQFRFERAGQSFVIVSNEQTKGHVVADAIQFLPVDTLNGDRQTPSSSSGKAAAITDKTVGELKRLEAELKQLTASAPYRPTSMSVVEQPQISDIQINIRGNIHNLGESVPRGFVQVCSHDSTPLPNNESGRRQLADWLASSENPLTARVMVNRLWHWTIGVGLVRTVDNFGTTGETPSHPELLDYLAQQLVDSGWSVKDVLREIVLSRTYRQASGTSSPNVDSARPAIRNPNGKSAIPMENPLTVDPENRLLGHMHRRRLDAESLRDSILSASGELRLDMGGPTLPGDLATDYGFRHSDTSRSVYSPVLRNSLPEIFEAFDFADPSVVTGRRNVSTVAPQALFLMNHPFVFEQSRHAAQRLLAEQVGDETQRVDLAFRRTLGRFPSPAERAASLKFIGSANSGAAANNSVSLWAQLFQSLFASIDFRYVE